MGTLILFIIAILAVVVLLAWGFSSLLSRLGNLWEKFWWNIKYNSNSYNNEVLLYDEEKEQKSNSINENNPKSCFETPQMITGNYYTKSYDYKDCLTHPSGRTEYLCIHRNSSTCAYCCNRKETKENDSYYYEPSDKCVTYEYPDY